MSAKEFQWLQQGHDDKQERPGGNGFSNGDWRRAREQHAQKMKAQGDD